MDCCFAGECNFSWNTKYILQSNRSSNMPGKERFGVGWGRGPVGLDGTNWDAEIIESMYVGVVYAPVES